MASKRMNYKFPRPSNLKFSEITIGSRYSFKKSFSNDDILAFANLVGDYNPLHINPRHGQKIYAQNIVHGMLVGSLFSTLLGMHCPGRNCLYLSQEIEFIKPVYPNTQIVVEGTVIRKVEALKILNIKTEVLVDKRVVIRGSAKVRILG